jgi:hypothetical protein
MVYATTDCGCNCSGIFDVADGTVVTDECLVLHVLGPWSSARWSTWLTCREFSSPIASWRHSFRSDRHHVRPFTHCLCTDLAGARTTRLPCLSSLCKSPVAYLNLVPYDLHHTMCGTQPCRMNLYACCSFGLICILRLQMRSYMGYATVVVPADLRPQISNLRLS